LKAKETQLVDTENQLALTKNELTSTQKELKDSNEKLADTEVRLDQTTNQRDLLAEQLTLLMKKHQEDVASQIQEAKRWHQQYGNEKVTREKLQASKEAVDIELSQVQDTNANLMNENESLQKDLLTWKDRCAQVIEKYKKLFEEQNSMKMAITKLRPSEGMTSDDMRKQLKVMYQLLQNCQLLKNKCEQLSQNQKQLCEENVSLCRELNQCQGIQDKMKSQNESLLAMNQKLMNKMEELTGALPNRGLPEPESNNINDNVNESLSPSLFQSVSSNQPIEEENGNIHTQAIVPHSKV
jgi:chromosome segregation ATPase